MDSITDLSSNKLTYYSKYIPSASKMPKHVVPSRAANIEAPSSAKRMQRESATQAQAVVPMNKPCQTDSCRGKLVSTGVNYDQPPPPVACRSSKTTQQSNQHTQHSLPSYPICMPPPPCYPPPRRPCFMPPSCYHPPPPCPRMMPESRNSQQGPQFYSYGPNRMGKPCWYRVPPPPCPYPLYPQYDMGAQPMNDQDYSRDPYQQPNQVEQYDLMPNDSNEAPYDDDDDMGGNGFYDENDTGERVNPYDEYNNDENYDPGVCSECRMNANDEEQLWQEPLGMQQRLHCTPPISVSCFPPLPPPPEPEMPQCYPTPKCCPAKKRHCKRMQGGVDMKNIGCDHCKAKPPNMECNHCRKKAARAIECDHCKAKAQNMECNRCKRTQRSKST